jgi:hypothetical protein
MAGGSNDSIITLGFDLAEETEQNAGIILSETAKAGAELAAAEEQSPSAFEREQADLEEARAAAEEARRREEAEKQQQQEQERSR